MRLKLYAVPLSRMRALHRTTNGSRQLHIEHSDMGRPDIFQRIYDDACDVGFATETPRGVVEWVHSSDVTSGDGVHEPKEVVAWLFAPMPESIRKWPDLAGWELHVLND